jgi:YgiT-type zinc finger domain-containing protein
MQSMKCMYCKVPTTNHKINVQKKISTKIITVSQAPVYYCKSCDETFLAKETLDCFKYIRDMGLDEKRILFNFEEINRKVSKD